MITRRPCKTGHFKNMECPGETSILSGFALLVESVTNGTHNRSAIQYKSFLS